MKKRNYLQFTISILLILTTGCEDDETKNVNQPGTLEPVTVTTSNVNSGDIYLNFSSGNEVSLNDNWHLSIVRDTSNYNMPSIVMGTANIGLYNDISFSEITSLPSDFQNAIVTDNTMFEYGGEHEILSYDMTVHKVGVTNPDYVYVLQMKNNSNESFKIQFIEYQSGITVLQYNSLSG